MRETTTFTVSLPRAMAKQVEQAMKAEHRTRSELVREALRIYLSPKVMPIERPTSAEARAYRDGIATYKRGDYVTLGEYIHGMDRRPRGPQTGVLSALSGATELALFLTCHPERSEFIRECERTRAVEGSLHCLSQQRRFREFSPAHLSRRRRQSVERLEAVVVAHANVGVLRLRSHFASRSGCSAQGDKI